MNAADLALQARAELARRELARRHVVDLAQWLSPHHVYERWHREVGEALDWLSNASARGESPRLLVEAPPGHGKTDLFGHTLPVLHMGRNPGHSVLYASHTWQPTTELVSRTTRERCARASLLWPHLSLTPGAETADSAEPMNTVKLWQTRGGGFFRAVSVGMGTAGTHVSLALMDDPFSNWEDVLSAASRDAVWNWIGADIESRLTRYAGGLGMTHTRWHLDDAAGRLRATGKVLPWPGVAHAVGGQWYVLSHPAIAEHDGVDWRKAGEALCPLSMGIEKLEQKRTSPTMNPQAWLALYQQRPSPAGGNVIQRAWTQKRHTITRAAALGQQWDDVLIAADLTFGASATSDYVSMQVWGRRGADCYLLGRVNARMTYTETRAAFRDLCGAWPIAKRKLVERAANGAAMVDDLAREIMGLVPVPVRGRVVPEKFASTAHLWEAGNVILPEASIAPWVGEYVEQIVTVPSAAHDDDAACTAHALTALSEPTAIPRALRRGLGVAV